MKAKSQNLRCTAVILLLFICSLLPAIGHAKMRTYAVNQLTGGCATCLDAITGYAVENGQIVYLQSGDMAISAIPGTGKRYIHTVRTSGCGAESSPDTIIPDDTVNNANKCWVKTTDDDLGDYDLNSLQDVIITTPAQGDALMRNGSNQWINTPLTTDIVTEGIKKFSDDDLSDNDTNDLPEGATNKYFNGKTQDDLPSGATAKQYNPAAVAITGGVVSGLSSAAVAGDLTVGGTSKLTQKALVNLTGSIQPTVSSANVVGVNTLFLTELKKGDKLVTTNSERGEMEKIVLSITDNTHLTVHTPYYHWASAVNDTTPKKLVATEVSQDESGNVKSARYSDGSVYIGDITLEVGGEISVSNGLLDIGARNEGALGLETYWNTYLGSLNDHGLSNGNYLYGNNPYFWGFHFWNELSDTGYTGGELNGGRLNVALTGTGTIDKMRNLYSMNEFYANAGNSTVTEVIGIEHVLETNGGQAANTVITIPTYKGIEITSWEGSGASSRFNGTNWYQMYIADWMPFNNTGSQGTVTNQYGLWLENIGNNQNATTRRGIVLDGNGAGSDIVFGQNQNVRQYYDELSGNKQLYITGAANTGVTVTGLRSAAGTNGTYGNTLKVNTTDSFAGSGTWYGSTGFSNTQQLTGTVGVSPGSSYYAILNEQKFSGGGGWVSGTAIGSLQIFDALTSNTSFTDIVNIEIGISKPATDSGLYAHTIQKMTQLQIDGVVASSAGDDFTLTDYRGIYIKSPALGWGPNLDLDWTVTNSSQMILEETDFGDINNYGLVLHGASGGSGENVGLLVDATMPEAILVRKNADGGDVFTVDSTNSAVRVTGRIDINDGGTKPTCDSTTRGSMWVDEGTTGVADTAEICLKNSSDTYAWYALATAP